MVIPLFFFYSPRVEQNRVVTISKALVITQERKTPAYYLYQQAKAIEVKQQIDNAPITTFLSSQNFIPPTPSVAVPEMKINHREIASSVDAGFTVDFAPQQPLQKFVATEVTKTDSAATSATILDYTQQFTQQPRPTNVSPTKKWATVRGKFEMRGVGVVDQFIELKRIEEGQVREIGRIDLKAGLYTIDIESPKGILVAEIKDKNGILIGEDRQKIVNLQSRGLYFEGPFIQVRHPETLASGVAIPSEKAASVTRGMPGKSPSAFVTTLFSDQNILENPTDEFGNVSRTSSTVSYISDSTEKNRKILTIRQTGDISKTPVFSEKWLQGAMEYISDQQQIEFKSKKAPILIGRVFVDNKPAMGIQVQIENHPGVEPIYLDQFMIPTSRQSETSENGYFMIVGVEEENYTVTAFKQNQIIGHQMFIAEEGVVSYQNILSQSAVSQVVVRSFDAFSAEPIEIDLITPDVEEVMQTIGGSIRYNQQNALGVSQFLIRTNQQNYLPIRYVQDSRKDYVHIPMIQEKWLNEIQTTRLINEMPDSGTVIGFVPDFDFDVYLIFEGYSQDQIVYFDLQGRISQSPIKGGGFILFNVPAKAHEVVVQEKDSDRIYSQVFDIKAGQISVAHFVD
jgi:hypothetical protein